MFDDTLHLFGCKGSYAGMIAQFEQFRFQYAMIVYPSPKLHDGRPAAGMRAVKHCQFAYSVRADNESCLFHI